MEELELLDERVTSFTKSISAGEAPWQPFLGTHGRLKEDRVLYCKGKRTENLTTGEVSFSWELCLINKHGSSHYIYKNIHSVFLEKEIDLRPLHDIFEALGWQATPSTHDTKVNHS